MPACVLAWLPVYLSVELLPTVSFAAWHETCTLVTKSVKSRSRTAAALLGVYTFRSSDRPVGSTIGTCKHPFSLRGLQFRFPRSPTQHRLGRVLPSQQVSLGRVWRLLLLTAFVIFLLLTSTNSHMIVIIGHRMRHSRACLILPFICCVCLCLPQLLGSL